MLGGAQPYAAVNLHLYPCASPGLSELSAHSAPRKCAGARGRVRRGGRAADLVERFVFERVGNQIGRRRRPLRASKGSVRELGVRGRPTHRVSQARAKTHIYLLALRSLQSFGLLVLQHNERYHRAHVVHPRQVTLIDRLGIFLVPPTHKGYLQRSARRRFSPGAMCLIQENGKCFFMIHDDLSRVALPPNWETVPFQTEAEARRRWEAVAKDVAGRMSSMNWSVELPVRACMHTAALTWWCMRNCANTLRK